MIRLLLVALGAVLVGFPVHAAGDGRPGRVTAIAEVIWACPLNDWAVGRDDRCDPIDTGSAVSIIERNIKPNGRHGPFALVEYVSGGRTKRQYVKDINVTPDDESAPTVESLLQREASRVPKEPAAADQPCAALTSDRAELALLAIIDSRMGESAVHRETRSALSQEEFLSRFFPATLSEIKAACSRGDEFSAGFALGGDLGLYFGVMHSKR